MTVKYLESKTSWLWRNVAGTAERDRKLQLLWGDRVRVIDDTGARWRVRARGTTGFVAPSALGNEQLLELYFIDVGQGDGVLIRVPGDPPRHLLIDGGWPRRSQPTGKNACDFVDWKFKRDYEQNIIDLDAVLCSHNDQDHYGALWDLFDRSAEARRELDVDDVTAEAIYHAGLSWWRPGSRTLGTVSDTAQGKMFTQLLGDRASVEAGLAAQGAQRLQGEWAKFLGEAVTCNRRDGTPTPFQRLSHASGTVPGFDDPNGVTIHVLAPVEFDIGGKPGIRQYASSTSQNTNGNSLLLRVDYGKTRVLLTGDLNLKSMQSLRDDYAGELDQFACDVAKGCHHGSRDVAMSLLGDFAPTATILSSGDSEGHDHPTPEVLAASGITGLQKIESDKLESPLVYITELARSVALGTPTELKWTDANGTEHTVSGDDFKNVEVTCQVTYAGDRSPRTVKMKLQKPNKVVPRQIVEWTTFGLINVRTDGKELIIAARNETDASWNARVIEGRF